MGAFIANFHVRGAAPAGVQQAIAQAGASQVRVSNPGNGWVSVYEQRASTQDERWIDRVARELSLRLQTACVAFMVHDSDVACYWLCDKGQLLDEYNSAPDYFEKASAVKRRRLQGQADVFVRFCRPGVTSAQVEAVLRAEVLFAEGTIQRLAEFLGIDPGRAVEDFGDGGGAAGLPDVDGGADDDDGPGKWPMSAEPDMPRLKQALQQRFASMFGAPAGQVFSEQSTALVDAAASGNSAEIERLVAAGTDVNAPGLLSVAAFADANLPLSAGLLPTVPLSPLMAAASRGQAPAVGKLLELGANAREVHPLCGSALHIAAQRGSAETLRVLLASGLPADVKNKQGLTPRALIQATRKQIETTRTMAQSMPQLQHLHKQLQSRLEALNLPEAGWQACEELLAQAGG